MSKKSRKRNRKILGALAAGLGAMALMKGRGTPAAANVDSGRDGTSSSALARVKANTPVTGVVYPGSNRRKKWISTNPLANKNWNKMDTSEVNMDYVAPGTTRYSNPDFGLGPWAAKKGGRAGHKSGGRVKGCGKAKRGFGRALKGGK